MGRPKSSTAGLADLFLTVYNSRKLSKYNKQIKLQDETLELQAARLDSKMDLIYQSVNMGNQIAMQSTMLMAQGTITGLLTLTAEVEKLSEQTWNVLSVMNEIDQKEEILGTLRLFLIEIEEEIERLNILKIDFPEFTAAILDEINLLFIENNVSIDKFKRMNSVEDIKWAKQVIREFEQLHHESMHARAVDEAHSARHELLIETIQTITELEQNVIQTTAEWTFDEYLARDTQLQGFEVISQAVKKREEELEAQSKEIEAIKSDIASQWIKISDLIPDQRIDSATLSNLSESVKRNL